jgi:hypothetical protein
VRLADAEYLFGNDLNFIFCELDDEFGKVLCLDCVRCLNVKNIGNVENFFVNLQIFTWSINLDLENLSNSS